MRRIIVPAVILFLVIAFTSSALSSENRKPRLSIKRDWVDGQYPELADPGLRDLVVSAQVDTYCIVHYDFEHVDLQGWTRVDNSIEPAYYENTLPSERYYFHVDDFAGLGGGDFGRLQPIEGTQSFWCGARPDPVDQYLCGWIYPPGYGNGWKQYLHSKIYWKPEGDVTFSYHARIDTEQDYDYVSVDASTQLFNYDILVWTELASYSGVVDTVAVHVIPGPTNFTKFRFRFMSDGSSSDKDGIINTDGAAVVDSMTIADEAGVLHFEDCESAEPGDIATGWWPPDWSADTDTIYRFWNAGPWMNLESHDPCNDNFGTQIVFFLDSGVPSGLYPGLSVTPFCIVLKCGTEKCQDVLVVSPPIDLTQYSTSCDENQDAAIPQASLPNLGGAQLRFTVYRDLPLENLVFYQWMVRNVGPDGCPGPWKSDGILYWGDESEYLFHTKEIGFHLEENAIQVGLRVVDMCQEYYMIYGDCGEHTPAPWFDNISVYRYESVGPQWSYHWKHLFQDNFPSEAFNLHGWIRADRAEDILPAPIILPGDCIRVSCTSPGGGGIAEDPDGWPMVFMHVRCAYIGTMDPPYGPQPEHIVGSSLEGSCGRYVEDDGAEWTTLQASRSDTPDEYTFDLNDSLLTRGYMVEYYFSATDSAGGTSYLPDDAPALADRAFGSGGDVYEGVSYIFEFTCLPTLASDILYVDDFHGRGTFWGTVEQYMNHSFLAVIPPGNLPDRYDVNEPSALVSNGLGSRAGYNYLIYAYYKIFWDSGDLSEGTICDGAVAGPDKSPDVQVLLDWMVDSSHRVGLWVLGDGIAEDLAGLAAPPATTLLDTCGVMLLSPDYYALGGGPAGGIVNPLVTGTGIFYHGGDPDEWYALGGCPGINDFDVLDITNNGVVAAAYAPTGMVPSPGAAVQSVTQNPNWKAAVQTMWFGFSFMYIRDTDESAPIIRNHLMKDVIEWMDNPVNPGVTEARVPRAYRLGQNFPNPFNPVTTIRFDMKEKNHVSVKVYSAAGQLVKTLVDCVKDAGAYEIPWDGRNNDGSRVASGIYFYRMETRNFIRTRKMVLVR